MLQCQKWYRFYLLAVWELQTLCLNSMVVQLILITNMKKSHDFMEESECYVYGKRYLLNEIKETPKQS